MAVGTKHLEGSDVMLFLVNIYDVTMYLTVMQLHPS